MLEADESNRECLFNEDRAAHVGDPSGEHDADALATVADFMASRKFDGYLNLGGLIDFSIISSHNMGNLRAVASSKNIVLQMPSSPNTRG